MRLPTVLALAFIACLASPAHAQRNYQPLEERLTPEQMRETGLDQLTAGQLERLNRILGEEEVVRTQAIRDEVEVQAKRERGSRHGPERELIVSKLKGEFRGWSPGTRFELENGQVWRVTDTPEYYVRIVNAVMAPAVVVSPGMVGGWYLQVEGHSPRAKVQLVK